MRGDFKSVSGTTLRPWLSVAALSLSLAFTANVQAARTGHGWVVSDPGQPLQIKIPLTDLTEQDISVLQVKIADAGLWPQVGLTPPAPVDTLRVVVQPGKSKDSRVLLVTSSQSVNQPVIDMLLDVATATGSSQMQVSFVVLTRESVASSTGLAGSISGSLSTKPGDTLFAIAQRNAIPGATVYQMLWALYQANPEDFIANNMNLLRSGAKLDIPDADTVRAVDPKMAQEMFLQHQQAYQQRRSGATCRGGVATPVLKPGATQSGAVTTPQTTKPPAAQGDQLRLTTGTLAEQRADAKVAAAKELAEVQARVDALQKNVQQLKEILAQPDDVAPGTKGAAGTAGTAGIPGAAGVTGATGAMGPAGAAGAAGTAGAAGAAGTSTVADSSTVAAAARAIPKSLDQLSSFLAENILVVLTGVLAICAFIIALVLRRAGARRDDDVEDTYAATETHHRPSGAANFDKTLNSIDLNLDSDSDSGPAPGKAVAAVAPVAVAAVVPPKTH